MIATQEQLVARLREWATAEGRPGSAEECGECGGSCSVGEDFDRCPRCSGRGWLRVVRLRPSERVSVGLAAIEASRVSESAYDGRERARIYSLVDLVVWEGADCGHYECKAPAPLVGEHGCPVVWRSALAAECAALGVRMEEA